MRLTWLALAVAIAQGPSSPGDLVRIDVVARDAKGRPVESLVASDFTLLEDGTPQTLADVRLVRVAPTATAGDVSPITSASDERIEAARENTRLIGIYLDDYYVSAASAPMVKSALHRFVDQDLGPRDLVAILRPLDSLLTIRLTRDHAALHRAIDAFEGRRGDYEPRTDFERSYIVTNRGQADVQRAQSTWSTLNALTLHLANLGAGRSSLLLVSEQADLVPRRRGFESLPSSTAVTRTANRSNVSIYVFDPRDDATRAANPDEGPNLLRVLADDTDGALFSGPNAVDTGLRQMIDDASSYYLASYRSVRNRDGLFHAVSVTVKTPGVKVRSRNGYWAPTLDEVSRANLIAHAGDPLPPIKLVAPRHASQLIRPWFGITRGDNGKIRVTFVWEPAGAVPGDRRVKTPTRVDMTAVGPDGATAFEGQVRPSGPAIVEGSDAERSRAVFDVPAGRVTFTMSIEDSATQTIDSDVRDVVIRDLAGAVVIGTPEVFRARTARDLRELRADAAAVPVAAREFSRAEHLLIRVPAYAPAPAPALTATLVSQAGQAMRQVDVEPAAPPVGLAQIDLPLAGLAPGQYSLEVAATSAAGKAKETVAFRVTN